MDAKVKFRVKYPIYWDNWGKIVEVFSTGDIVEGEASLSVDGETVIDVTAESPYYNGISDFVDMNNIEILEIVKVPQPLEER